MKRLMCIAAVAALGLPVAAQDKAADVMKQAREALGGNKLAQVKALSLEGPFAREMGNRQVQGTLALTLQLPDRMHRTEDTEMMGGMSIERTSVLAGTTSWEDMQNRGGMGRRDADRDAPGPAGTGAQPAAGRGSAPAAHAHRVQPLPAGVSRRRRARTHLRCGR